MADVQTEHGYVKIANRIVEAILDAKFTGTQVRILLALVRLTYGWRRRTVAISILDLAKLCGLAGTGGFRRALYDLIHNGVVLELVEGKATVYAIQKDYVQWRAFGGNEGKLAARWDKRPTHDDALLRHVESSGQLTLQGSSNEPETTDEPDSDSTPQGSDPARNDPTGLGGVPHRVPGSTPQGNETGAKSLFGETVDGGKDRKDNEIQEARATTTPAAADPELEPDCEFARGIATAANNAIALRWANARTLHWSSATQLASDLRRMGVSLEVARHAVVESVRASKNPRAPFALEYFRPIIVDAFRQAEQRELNAKDPGVRGERGGAPSTIASLVDRGKDTRTRLQREQDEMAHGNALRNAATQWANDPANAADYRAIVEAATKEFGGFGGAEWAEKARAGAIFAECAKRAEFPDFRTWLAERVGVGAA